MADRSILRDRMADVLVGLDHVDDWAMGHGATLADADPFQASTAREIADALLDAAFCDDEQIDPGHEALAMRADTAESRLRRVLAGHTDDGFGACAICWESPDAMSPAQPAPFPCAVVRAAM